ncbi:MAG: hypothetical protein ACTHK8_01825 [Ginsengibacter sp.]
MLKKKQFPLLFALLISFHFCNAQIEGAYAITKNFHAFGFGGFLNFSLPVSEANYLTIDAGYEQFKDNYDLDVAPVLLGYRYTLDQSGSGWYVEPNVGYAFNAGGDLRIQGASAGFGLGYLVDVGSIPFNFGLRYEHVFGSPATEILSFRIAHSLSLGFRNREDY